MASKNADAPAAPAAAALNTAGNRGILSQLGLPGASAASNLKGQESNNNLALELAQNNKMSPQVGPAVAAVAAASPSFLRLAGPSRHSALSTSANIVDAERRLREGSFSSTGPTVFIGNRNGSGGSSAFRAAGAVGAEGANGIELALGGAAGGGAEEANEEQEIVEPDIFDEFEDTADINAEYAQDFFNDETLKNMPPELFDNLIEALETIEEEDGENSNNNRNANVRTNANTTILLQALQQTKETLKKLDQEKKSVKSSASNKISSSSLGSAKESTIAVGNLARELLRVGTSGVADADAEAPEEVAEAEVAGAAVAGAAAEVAAAVAGAGAGKRTRSGRNSKPPTKYDPEIVRKLIRRTKVKSKRPRPASQLASGLSDVSNMTALTATKAFIMAMKGSRIEGPKPDSQLKFIHGQEVYDSINENTLCDLCGFSLKYRQPDDYYIAASPNYRILKWSYDHTIPVNYAAVVFKVYFTDGQYSEMERNIMSFLGGPTCYHCNLEKSQQKFITCPDAKKTKWRKLRPNVMAINSFLTQLLHSSRKGDNAINAEGNTSLRRQINRIIPKKGQLKDDYWIEIRKEYIKKKCEKICELIKTYVDYDSAYARVKLMRSVIKAERAILDAQMPPLRKEVIKRRVSKKARDALFECSVQPWIEGSVELQTQSEKTFPFYSPVVTALQFTPEVAPARNGAVRSRRRKQMRKRTRKNLRLR